MKFQSCAFRRGKLKVIGLILIATFLLLDSTPGEALWGKKTKEISGEELKKIKAELNISEDPRFHSYSDPDLKEVLDKEINPQRAPGLTYGVFILNAVNEEKLVDLCSKSSFNDKESSRFFSMLADNLTSWQKNFAEKTTKVAIKAIVDAYKMHGLSIGTSSLFLAVDLAQIGVGIIKLAEVIRNRALWYYITSRKMGAPHKSAWDTAGVPIGYRNKQTEEYFRSLWDKHREYMSEDGLDEDFKNHQHETLKTLLLCALGEETKLIQLYFSDSQGCYLVPEERKISALPEIDQEANEILKELIKGPLDSSLRTTIPIQTQVEDVYVKDDCFYVNFSSSLKEKHPGGTAEALLTIYSIVNTLLVNFPSQSRVQILIQGKPIETFGGFLIRNALRKRLDIVKLPPKQ